MRSFHCRAKRGGFPRRSARALLLIPGLLALVSCSSVRTHYNLEQPTSRVITSSIGGVLFRLNVQGDLPNAFGRADLYGGKVDKGYAEVRLRGIEEGGILSLEIREVNLDSAETTMDRYGRRPDVAVDVSTHVTAVPGADPNATLLRMDLSKATDLVVAGVRITFLEVSAYSVSYRLENLNQDR